jgi:hypothetical protein
VDLRDEVVGLCDDSPLFVRKFTPSWQGCMAHKVCTIRAVRVALDTIEQRANLVACLAETPHINDHANKIVRTHYIVCCSHRALVIAMPRAIQSPVVIPNPQQEDRR